MGYILGIGEDFDVPNNAHPGVELLSVGERVFAREPYDLLSGADNNFHMTQTNWEQLTGYLQYTFFDEFYNRIHLIPDALDFGTFSIEKTLYVTVWNAYLTDVVFETSVPDDGSEVSMGMSSELPYTFNALQVRSYPFTATAEGSLVLSDQFTLTFDSGDVELLDITGFRLLATQDALWPFLPEWSEGYSVAYAFKTDIIVSEHGDEQRRKVRQSPRKSFEFGVTLKNTDRREYNRLMTSNQKARFYVPELTRWQDTEVELLAGEVTLAISEQPWWIADGYYVILRNGEQQSVRRIGTVVEDSNSTGYIINFDSNDVYDWPVGSKIHPAVICFARDEADSAWLTNYVSTARAILDGAPGLEPVEPTSSPTNTFLGRELWLKKPNWAQPFDAANIHPTNFVDFEKGRVERGVDIDYNKLRVRLSYLGRDTDEAEELLQFFKRCAGRNGEFYMPTWAPDIDLSAGFADIDDTVFVDGADFGGTYADDPTRAAILIELIDDTQIFKEILSITAEEDSNSEISSVIQLAEAIGTTATLADIRKISWVNLWRFSSDTLTINWQTSTVASTFFTVETLEQQQADIDDSNSGSGS